MEIDSENGWVLDYTGSQAEEIMHGLKATHFPEDGEPVEGKADPDAAADGETVGSVELVDREELHGHAGKIIALLFQMLGNAAGVDLSLDDPEIHEASEVWGPVAEKHIPRTVQAHTVETSALVWTLAIAFRKLFK